MMNNEYKYTAFISYRHLKPDADIAQKIHTTIETFKVPKSLWKDNKAPKFRVFRDREELTTASLSDSLEEALRSSEFLIVICSKRLPLSEWCNKEVEQFIAMNGIDRVIPVLIEGEPHESFPHILKGYKVEQTDDDGNVSTSTKEILAAELRTNEVLDPSFEGYEYLEKNNPQKLERLTKESINLLKTEKYRIMAAILGVTYGDLKQRDKERRQRQLLISSVVASALLLFFGIFMFNAYRNENIAKLQTIQDRSQMMLNNAQDLINQGDRIKAIILSNQAIDDIDPSMASYERLKDQHYAILNNTMDLDSSSVLSVIQTNNRFTFLDFDSTGEKFIAGLNNDAVGIWDTKTGQLLNSVIGHTQQVKLVDFASDDNTFVSGGFDDLVNLWDSNTLEKIGTLQTDGNVMLLQFSDDDTVLNVIVDTLSEYIYQKVDAKTLETIGKPITLNNGVKRVVFDETNQFMIVNYNTFKNDQSMILYDLDEGRSIHNYSDQEKQSQDLQGNDTLTKFPYIDVRVTDDFKYFYSISGSDLVKVNIETNELEYRVNIAIYNESLPLVQSSDKQFIYVGNGTMIEKYHAQTGEKLLEILNSSEEIVTMLQLSEDNKTLVSLSKGGEIRIFNDDYLTESKFDYKSGMANYVYLSPDHNHLLALSLTDQNIKSIILNPDNASLKIPGQIVALSQNSKYSLFYGEQEYFLFDNDELKTIRTVTSKDLDASTGYIPDGRGYIISNDGTKIGGLDVERDSTGRVEKLAIYVISSETGERVYQKEIEMNNFYFGFTHDSQYVYANSNFDEITMYSLTKENEDKIFKVEPGFINGIRFSTDTTHFSVTYEEGISGVYEISSGELKETIAGEILSLNDTDNGLEIISLYNNIGSKQIGSEKVSEVTLSKQRDEKGQYQYDQNLYNSKENLLLTIKDTPEVRYAYLVDFETGQLIKTYEIPLDAYRVRGYITPNGQGVVLDSIYAQTKTDFSEDYSKPFLDQFKITKMSDLYQLLDYDTIYEQSKDYIKDVNLTEQERIDLGVGQ